jgi:hypothetical protein
VGSDLEIDVKTIFAAAALAATAFLALPVTAANAATYVLNTDFCSGGGCGSANYGTINVTGQGTGTLTVDIELNANAIFQVAGSNPHDEIWFDTNTSSVDVEGLAAPFSANGSRAEGSHVANGTGGAFDYVLQRAHGGNPSTPATGQHSLIFTLTGPPTLALGSTHVGANDLFFVVDVAGYNAAGALVNTGRIGATLQGGVPEPASWALMILGFGGVGAMLRANRRRMALATAA